MHTALIMALLSVVPTAVPAQETRASAPSRVCVVEIREAGDLDQALTTATSHCRVGDVLNLYDRTAVPLVEYEAIRVCDLRYPVRPLNEREARGLSGFTCIYAGGVRATVRAG